MIWLIFLLAPPLLALYNPLPHVGVPPFRVRISPDVKRPVLGRLVVFLAVTNDTEPRTQCSDGHGTAQIFAVDVDHVPPGGYVDVENSVRGYPRGSLVDVQDMEVYIQAEIRPYEVYNRGDGVNLTLPTSCVNPDGGNDGEYPSPIGTIYTSVIYAKLTLNNTIELEANMEVVPTHSPGCSGEGNDTKWIKTVRVKSSRLSKFWGRDMVLEACVLLPYGFYDYTDARYPTVIAHGHYSVIFAPGGGFRPEPPKPDARGYEKIAQTYDHYLYTNWTSSDSIFKHSRMLVVTINHPVPFFDDSYAVNSANVGPYGDAIMLDLLPVVEKRFRGIGEGWARGLFGGSTGGWEAIAAQVFYPTEFNGVYAACPDPVSFTSYTTVNIYEERNAYYYDAPFKKTPRPSTRDAYSGTIVAPGSSNVTFGHPYGQTQATMEESNYRELILGPRSRSCGQFDIWEAVFSPRGQDGYPQRIWDKSTGEINKTTAEYWRDNYDLLHILKRDWKKLGPLLVGKIHLFVGGSDTFFLNNAVMDMQDYLESTTEPYYNGSVVIGTHDGRGFEHCFNGYAPDGTVLPNGITRNLYLQKFIPAMSKRFLDSAPPNSNLIWASY